MVVWAVLWISIYFTVKCFRKSMGVRSEEGANFNKKNYFTDAE